MCDGELSELVHQVGRDRVLKALRVHRATLARWMSGEVRPPVAVLLLLRVWASGRLPGMSDRWDGFRVAGDAIEAPDGRQYGPLEIAAIPALRAALEAAQARAAMLEAQLIEATRAAAGETANDAQIWPADVRSRAYSLEPDGKAKRPAQGRALSVVGRPTSGGA